MDCKIDPGFIIEFHFGHLTLEARQRAEDHLKSCPHCLEEFFLLKRDMESAHIVPVVPPTTLRAKALALFQEHRNLIWPEEHRLWIRAHKRKLVVGGLAAAAAVLAVMLARGQGPIDGQDRPLTPPSEMHTNDQEMIDRAGTTPAHINIL